VALWCPEQSHQETASQALRVYDSPSQVLAAEVDGYLCAGNFGDEAIVLPGVCSIPAGQLWPISWGVSGATTMDSAVTLRLGAQEPAIVALR
jgi:hypothetical protein